MRHRVGIGVSLGTILLAVGAMPDVMCRAQQTETRAPATPPAASKALTVERIYSQPGLSGQLTRGIAWTPDAKQISFFKTEGAGREAKTELWVMDVATGQRRALLSAEKLESLLPADPGRNTQATGLGRH